jgi:hypothetical protein
MRILILFSFFIGSLCFAAATGEVPMIRSMDQLIANLAGGGTGTIQNSECTAIFDEVCPIGCNGRIGAEALLLDQCGVCGGNGSSCDSGGDDDGSCDATCIGLVIGIPLGLLVLLIIGVGILCFSGIIVTGRRRRGSTRQQQNVTSHMANKHFSNPIRRQVPAPTYAPHQTHRSVTMTSKKRTSAIRWTNGWGKGNKNY